MLTTILRTFIIYCAVSFCVRLMGKRQLGELQPGELVITILISEIAAIPIDDSSVPLINALIPLLLLVSLEIISSVLDRKSVKFRYLTEGHPITIIKNGTLMQKEMKKLRFTINDVLSGLRQKDVFDIEDVEFAVVETNGTLSVLLKPDKRPATAQAMGKKEKDTGMPYAVIVDGEIMDGTLEECKLTKAAVLKKAEREAEDIKNILLLTVDKNKKYNIILKKED